MKSSLILGGPGRAGTTSLFSSLARERHFVHAGVKEMCYFLDGQDICCQSDYLRKFPTAEGRITLEASPQYFGNPSLVGPLLARVFSDIDYTIVFVLRDPLDRFVSGIKHYVTKVSIGQSTEGFVSKAISDYEDGTTVAGGSDAFKSLTASFYLAHLTEWFRHVPAESIIIIFFEDLSDEHFGSVKTQLGRRLGIDLGGVALDHINRSASYRSARLQRAAQKLNTSLERMWIRTPALKSYLRRIYDNLNRVPMPDSWLAESSMDAVTKILRNENHGLQPFLATNCRRDLPAWTKDYR